VRVATLLGVVILPTAVCSALAAPPEAPRHVEVRFHGEPLEFSPSYLAHLGHAVEQLAVGSWYADQSPRPEQPPDFQILVTYAPPLSLELPTREHQTIQVRQLELSTSSSADEGWPVLFASTTATTWFLAKYNGPLVLDIFCSPELEPYAPAAIQSNCHLAPSHRHAGDGPPNPSLQRTTPGHSPGCCR
jgi:hypothetical protein